MNKKDKDTIKNNWNAELRRGGGGVVRRERTSVFYKYAQAIYDKLSRFRKRS